LVLALGAGSAGLALLNGLLGVAVGWCVVIPKRRINAIAGKKEFDWKASKIVRGHSARKQGAITLAIGLVNAAAVLALYFEWKEGWPTFQQFFAA
jgi:hypothetical protein